MLARIVFAVIGLFACIACARADCVQLTVANGGIGNLQPTSGGGASRPTNSNWGPPTNPGQLGSNATLGFNDDAVAIWSTIPYQSYSSGVIRLAIDTAAIGGISAGSIKFAINGGTYIAATTYPNSSPIGASGEACAYVNVADVPPGQLEARAEICPTTGWCRELSSVQAATVPSGSEVVTLPAHGQIPPKFVALTSPSGDTTNFAPYSASSSGTLETYHNIYCLAGTVTPNSFLLIKAASATRNNNGTSTTASITCAPTISGYIDGTSLIVTTADSKGTSLANASPLTDVIGGGGYNCQIIVSTVCPFVTSDTSGVGAVGVYTLSATSGTSGLNWTGTATISGTALTIVSTTSGTIAAGQTLGEDGGGSIVTIASGSGSSWVLSAAPGNVASATAMSTGTPASMFAGQIAKASSSTAMTVNYWDAGPHEQFPTANQEKNHNDASLFLFVDKSPINDFSVYANSVALLGGTGIASSSPVNSIDAAIGSLTPTNTGLAQTVASSGGCSTFTRTGNTGTGNAFFHAGDPVYLDSPVGYAMSNGLYYVLTAATNVITLSAIPGGACVDDTTVTSGSAYLFRDFSTTTVDLQCYATFGVQCTQQAGYAFNTASEGTGYTRGSYVKIQPDPGAGGDLAVPQFQTALTTDGGHSMTLEDIKYTGAIIYPTVQVPLIRPIPSGTAPPVLTVPTAALAGFTVTASASFGTGTIIASNDCIPSGFYGTVVSGATAGSSVWVSAVTNNGDGTTSLTLSANGSYSPLTSFNYCPIGDVFTFVNPWHLHNGSTASGSLWLDQVKLYGSQGAMTAADIFTGPFGTGQFYKLFITNSSAQYLSSGFSYASIIENSYGYAVYTKCAENDVIIINSRPCDAMSNTFRARFMPVTGPPSPFYEPATGSSNTNNTITMLPANMPLGLSYLWAVQYKCGTTTATTSLTNFSYITGVLTVSPGLNSSCISTPVSLVHMIDGSHEDCNQYDTPDDFINTNFYDGYNSTAACFGFQTLMTATNSLMMDTVFLNSNLLYGTVNPEISPGYYDLQLQLPTTNLYVHNSDLSYVSKVNGSFSTPGPGDVVWDNSPCPATPGFITGLVGVSYPFLSIINNPASGGC